MRSLPSSIKVLVLLPLTALLCSCTSVAQREPDSTITIPSPIRSVAPTAIPMATVVSVTTSIPTRTPLPPRLEHEASPAPIPTETPPSASQPRVSDQATIRVSLDIRGAVSTLALNEGGSAYDLLVAAQRQGSITFSGRQFSGVGFFVEEINGLKQDPRKGMYWIYAVNGKKANVGVSSYVLHEGDRITFTYEAADE